MKKFLFICLIFNFAILNAQEDFLCNAINVFNSLGTDAYTVSVNFHVLYRFRNLI